MSVLSLSATLSPSTPVLRTPTPTPPPKPTSKTTKLWSQVGTPEHFTWFRKVLVGIFALNIADGLLTVYWVYTGFSTEANPLMDILLGWGGPGAFMAIKLLLVGLGLILLWRARHTPAAVIASFALFLIYYALIIMHLTFGDLGVAF